MVKKKYFSQEEKTSFVLRWQESGLSKIAFAKENGIVYDTFLGWMQQPLPVEKTTPSKKVNPDPSFVSIQVSPNTHTAKPGIPIMDITLANGSQISFYQTVPIDYLRNLLK
jgi:hypothetical protein